MVSKRRILDRSPLDRGERGPPIACDPEARERRNAIEPRVIRCNPPLRVTGARTIAFGPAKTRRFHQNPPAARTMRARVREAKG
jgi:hypothetical protein